MTTSTNITSNNKRIAKNTLLLYFRMLLTMGISLYTSRVILNTLGEIDYGIYNVVGGFVAMFAVISGAMTTATQRFLSFEIGKGRRSNVQIVFSTTIIIHCLLAGVILILGETVGIWFLNTQMNFPSDRYMAANWVFQFSLLTFIINVISVPYNAAIIAYEKMKAFAYVSVIEVTLKLIIVYLLVVSPWDKLIVYAILLAMVAISIRLIYSVYCNRNFRECRCNWKWDYNQGKAMMSFVSWNLIGTIAGVAKEQGINVLLNIFFGATINAARGIAYQVLSALNGFINNFQLAMNPQIVKSYAANEKKEMFDLVFKGSRFSFLMMTIISIPIIIETPFILNVWLKNPPEYTTVFVRLVLLTALVDSLSGALITSMHASGKVRGYQIIVGGTSLLTLPVAYLFLKLNYPPFSAMAVSLCFAGICHFERLILLNKTIDLPVKDFLKEVTLRAFFIFLLSLSIPLILYICCWDVNWISFISICLISFLSSAFWGYTLGLNTHERSLVKSKIRNIIHKIIS